MPEFLLPPRAPTRLGTKAGSSPERLQYRADPQQLTTFAFCFGYIQALIKAVDRLPA